MTCGKLPVLCPYWFNSIVLGFYNICHDAFNDISIPTVGGGAGNPFVLAVSSGLLVF